MYTLSRSPLAVATLSPCLPPNVGTANITEKTQKKTYQKKKIKIKRRKKKYKL
jgi:hypothetical protein